MALCDDAAETEVAAATGLLAIADDASVASKPSSSAASASDSKETTQSSPVWSEEKPHPAQASGLGGGQEDAHGGLATCLMGLDCVGRGEAAHCTQTHRSASEIFLLDRHVNIMWLVIHFVISTFVNVVTQSCPLPNHNTSAVAHSGSSFFLAKITPIARDAV